jgi:hypothetical protein
MSPPKHIAQKGNNIDLHFALCSAQLFNKPLSLTERRVRPKLATLWIPKSLQIVERRRSLCRGRGRPIASARFVVSYGVVVLSDATTKSDSRQIPKMKLQGSGVFHPKTLQSQNCQPAENRASLNGLEFVHGQRFTNLMRKGLITCRNIP